MTYSQRKEWSIVVDPKIFQRLETTGKNFKITIINILICLAEMLNNKHET